MKIFGFVALSLFAALVFTLIFSMWLDVEPDGGVLALALLLGCVVTLALRALAALVGGGGEKKGSSDGEDSK